MQGIPVPRFKAKGAQIGLLRGGKIPSQTRALPLL